MAGGVAAGYIPARQRPFVGRRLSVPQWTGALLPLESGRTDLSRVGCQPHFSLRLQQARTRADSMVTLDSGMDERRVLLHPNVESGVGTGWRSSSPCVPKFPAHTGLYVPGVSHPDSYP